MLFGGSLGKTIETLDVNELPLKWTKFHGQRPYACDDHQTVVYQQSVIHIGGYIWDKCEQSNVVRELQLTSSCTMRELCRIPERRENNGAEVFEDKVLILGGRNSVTTTDCVLEFDPKRNESRNYRLP